MEKQEKFGKVSELKGYRALVLVKGQDGEEQAIDALNNLNAKKGDKVKVVWRKTSRMRDISMIVGPPLLCIAAGIIFGYRMALYLKMAIDMGIAAGVAIWLLLGISYSFRYWRYAYGRGLQPVIDAVEH